MEIFTSTEAIVSFIGLLYISCNCLYYCFSPIISDLPYDLFKLTMHTMQTFVADAGIF